jgi:hypothetical protein
MQPMLKEATEETARTMAQIAEDKAVAEVTAIQVGACRSLLLSFFSRLNRTMP